MNLRNNKIKVAMLTDTTIDRQFLRSVGARRLAEGLLKSGEVELYLVHFKKSENDPLYREAHEIVIPPIPLSFKSNFLSFLWFCLTTKHEFDVFSFMVPRPYPFFWLVPAKKLVMIAHGGGDVTAPTSHFNWSKLIFNFVMRHFGNRFDAVMGASEFGCKEIIYAYHIHPEKAFMVYPGMDSIYNPLSSEIIEQTLKKYNMAKKKYFLSVGGLVPHKNVPRSILAYDSLRKNNPEIKEKLVIIGKESVGVMEVRNAANKSAFSKDIIFFSYIPLPDMPSFYGAATALVFPSLNEGFGLPALEAMASGTPVITSNLASLPEVSGGATLLVNPYKVEEIEEAMKLVVKDEALRKRLIISGLERAKNFSWEKYVKGNLDVYKKILI